MGSIKDRRLNDALADYYETRRGAYAPSTWKAHEQQLELFRKWVSRNDQCGADCLLSDIDERTCTRYFNRLRPPAKAHSTFNNYRQYVQMFFDFCRGEAWIDRNPMRHVDPMPVPRKKRLQLSATELIRGLESASPRDRIALALGSMTGLRADDIMALRVGDVNLLNDTLHAYVHKTRQFDDLPIDADLRAELLRWFQHYAEVMGLEWTDLPNSWTLVPPLRRRDTLDPNSAVFYLTGKKYVHPEKIVHRMLERLEHPTAGEGFHTLRRSAARQTYEFAMQNDVDDPMRIAQALLGHRQRSTTERYLGMTVEKELRDKLLRGRSFLRSLAENEARHDNGETNAIRRLDTIASTDGSGLRRAGM